MKEFFEIGDNITEEDILKKAIESGKMIPLDNRKIDEPQCNICLGIHLHDTYCENKPTS
jgi:hypothetical protein